MCKIAAGLRSDSDLWDVILCLVSQMAKHRYAVEHTDISRLKISLPQIRQTFASTEIDKRVGEDAILSEPSVATSHDFFLFLVSQS
jgi:hypothetical protein